MEHSRDGLYWIRPDGKIASANAAACRDLGYAGEELLELGLPDFVCDISWEQWPKVWTMLKSGELGDFETNCRSKSGREVPCEVRATHAEFEGEEFVIAFLRNITKRSQAEKELRLTRVSVEKSSDCILWVRPDGTIRYTNRAACDALGYTREEMEMMSLPEISANLPLANWPEEWEEFKAQDTRNFESTARRKNGTEFQVGFTGTHMQFEGEEYLFVFVRDITQRKRKESQLHEALAENRRLREQLEAENVYLREEIRLTNLHGELVGESRLMTLAMLQGGQVAQTDSTVLILGETGTGKELMARAIHKMSRRSQGPLVVVNCAATPANLVENGLFGRERGAYTGAHNRQMGRFEVANGGTIFLDEIGELPEEIQAKLSRGSISRRQEVWRFAAFHQQVAHVGRRTERGQQAGGQECARRHPWPDPQRIDRFEPGHCAEAEGAGSSGSPL